MGKSEEPWIPNVLYSLIGEDIPRLLGIPKQHFTRDLSYLERRLACEGESFITKTLPSFCVQYDAALQGHVQLLSPMFKKRGRSALPAFLSALHLRVFTAAGWVRDEPCTLAIRLTRQILLYCKKIKRGMTDEMVQQAELDFIQVDEALPSTSADFSHAARRLVVGARLLANEIFQDIGNPAKALPKHGPGAVSDARDADGKRSALRSIRYVALERMFRPLHWFYALTEMCADAGDLPPSLVRLLTRPSYEHGVSKLKFVPKTVRTVRTIGFEPAAYMWCQQALKDLMVSHLESNRITSGHVNFADQTVNRKKTSDWSDSDTLDMSKASDRNSYALAEGVLGETRLWPWLDACRTPCTELSTGALLRYKKFAPMGSATCFPVQSVIYFCLAVTALMQAGMPGAIARRSVFVYGDDLITPHGYYTVLDEAFSSVGLKFNPDKCCMHGKFRESCGMDAFDGVDVSPVRLKTVVVNQPSDVLSVVAHAHELTKRGYWVAAHTYEVHWRTTHNLNFLSTCEDLPIITWPSSHKLAPSRHKDGIRYVSGWAYVPEKLRGDVSNDGAYLMESLIHGGPVGDMVTSKDGLCNMRELAAKYRGRIRHGSHAVTTAVSTYLPENGQTKWYRYADNLQRPRRVRSSPIHESF